MMVLKQFKKNSTIMILKKFHNDGTKTLLKRFPFHSDDTKKVPQ